MDARRGGGHILALDQGGASIHSKSYQGLAHLYPTRANFVNAPYLLQAIYELAMVLATRSLCNLASLNVFGDDIPQVEILEITQRIRHDILSHIFVYHPGPRTTSG